MRGVPNIAFFPSGKPRYRGFWMTDAGLRRIREAIKEYDGVVHRAAIKLGVCDQTAWRGVTRMRLMGQVIETSHAHRGSKLRGLRVDVSANRSLRIMNGNTVEIDGTDCPLAKRYEWEGHRMYASEAAHVSHAGPELRK
jgi:hypothetical protein